MPIEADLHLHSHYSDGIHPPARVVEMAAGAGLKAIALTDHDTVEGIAEALDAAPTGLLVIPGVELSSDYRGREIHLLAYFVDPDDASLRSALRRYREDRATRAERMVARLNQLGIPATMDEVHAAAGAGGARERASVGRPHIADVLVRRGAVRDIDDAFARYLGRGRPAYVARSSISVPDAIRLVRAAGGALVVAHPGLNLAEGDVEALVSEGLDGIEVLHPKHAEDQRRRLEAIARRAGVIITGGSDYHGPGRNRHDLASAGVSMATVASLRARAGGGR